MTARFVRDSPAIQVKSVRIDSSARRSIKRAPVGPPARPVAITGRSSSLSARATLTPLPPATVLASTARWRWPCRKLGTATVRSIAALRVTVRIIRSPPPSLPSRASCAFSPRASCASLPVSAVLGPDAGFRLSELAGQPPLAHSPRALVSSAADLGVSRSHQLQVERMDSWRMRAPCRRSSPRPRRERPRAGSPPRPCVDADGDVAENLALLHGSADLGWGADMGGDVLALAHVDRESPLGDQGEMVAAVVELRIG